LNACAEKSVPALQGKIITNKIFQWFDVEVISEQTAYGQKMKYNSIDIVSRACYLPPN
jgi:hypothetical protein